MYREVYLDNNATTPIHPEVKSAIMDAINLYGNPSSMHHFGQAAQRAIEESRAKIAGFIGCNTEELIFTGSGSEANNTVINSIFCENMSCAIKNCSEFHKQNYHIITTEIEHPSILQTIKNYQQKGCEVTYLPVYKDGIIKIEDIKKAIKPTTGMISVMFANNEIGTIQPIQEIASISKEKRIYFHTDAVQAFGKIKFNVKELGVDFLSISAHKVYAPKGIGALYVNKSSRFCPLIYGGHHERNRRAGTENTIGIIAFGKSVEIIQREIDENNSKMLRLKKKLTQGLKDKIPYITINGNQDKCLANTLNVTFEFIEGESILLYADLEGIAFSTGSACSTGSLDPSHVILALGVAHEHAHGSIRFSLGRNNTEEDIDYVLEKLPPVVERLRKMSPLYK